MGLAHAWMQICIGTNHGVCNKNIMYSTPVNKTPNEEESSVKSGEEDYSYCDIGSSQEVNAMHVLAELWSMRLTIFVVMSNKEQGMDHFVQQCLK